LLKSVTLQDLNRPVHVDVDIVAMKFVVMERNTMRRYGYLSGELENVPEDKFYDQTVRFQKHQDTFKPPLATTSKRKIGMLKPTSSKRVHLDKDILNRCKVPERLPSSVSRPQGPKWDSIN
jgi:hypothetical protein